ncbi:hypothetical protein [Clostridium sp. Marseille-QA1073]
MKKRIGILVLMGLVAVNTFYTTAFAKELKIISKDFCNKTIMVFADEDPMPW